MKNRSDLWLAAAMVACLALLAALIWQGVAAARQHLAVARQVLTGYSELAATNYGRQVKGQVGFWIVHRVGQAMGRDPGQVHRRLEAAIATAGADPQGDPRAAAALAAIRGVWHWEPETGSFACVHGRCTGFAPDLLANTPLSVSAQGFSVIHREAATGLESAAVYPADSGGWLGAEHDSAELMRWLDRIANDAPLLPDALVPDDKIVRPAVELLTPGGETLFRRGGIDLYDMSGSAVLDGDYGGLFEGFTVRAGIDPALAPDLIIGGLPSSRLWILLPLMVITAGLTLAVFRLLWRERQLSRMRADFVARVSHELRTPLTQIRMFTETLLLGRERDEKASRLYLKIIDREARRLGHLVDNVLVFSRQRRTGNALAVRSIKVRPLLEEIVAGFEPIAAGAGARIALVVEGDPAARIDDEAFRQVVLNLLDNACKYGPENQTITVETGKRGGAVMVRITDEGPGIPATERERVWAPFQRLAREDRRARHGTGIGLAVSRDLLAAMDAEYRICDGRHGGAVFELLFRAHEDRDAVKNPAG